MPEKEIFILTGPVRSGKSTALQNWSANRNDLQGIITPIVDGNRVFVNVQDGEWFPMETLESETAVLTVGRYRFSKENFDRAARCIRNALGEKGVLVIDEVGPLELRGEGFHDVLQEVLASRDNKLLLVVREGLTQQVKEYFQIAEAVIINKEELHLLTD